MKITATEEYGLRCLLRVATATEDAPISAQTIAELEGLSLPHTQKMLRILSQGGLVDSKRGAHGGYYAARPAEEVSVGDVMRVLGGFLEVEELCGRHTGELQICRHACDCTIRPVWSHISEYVMSTMDRLPLSLLTQNEKAVRDHLSNLDPADLDTKEDSTISFVDIPS
ncbi:RrF2 family transcriptional regulator [Bradymonas sediminis]|uniref:Transcriptional regulator n=1 Tax=Bradymonas sediminis TaxID=1548548 RepID=A0A2Z4FHH9_9DELT|nr:Rrf2 family transcriptional regulator [Bradymonas sediminis]AWV88106.1 transcriptional regulator [Bradymonas sediminis]TDP77229.1 BadM/Rrf2 family transcriptional regulator [Bradymonas sediminis]